MARRSTFFALLFIAVAVLVVALLWAHASRPQVVGNQKILEEINALLVPLDAKNISVQDFQQLQKMTAGDEKASDEVAELELLARYKEYAHIGHGLGFLYEYIKTGKELICPGHSLSHYYVFMRHGEEESATNNLQEAKKKVPAWNTFMLAQNESYRAERNYTTYREMFAATIGEIDNGNQEANESRISELANAPCAHER